MLSPFIQRHSFLSNYNSFWKKNQFVANISICFTKKRTRKLSASFRVRIISPQNNKIQKCHTGHPKYSHQT